MLLAKRTKPPFKWSFPGGSVESGESAEEAAIREVREEVSLDIALVAKAGEREVLLPGRRYLISVFAARVVAGEAQTGPEASEVGWFALDTIAAIDTTEGLLESALAAERLFLAAKG